MCFTYVRAHFLYSFFNTLIVYYCFIVYYFTYSHETVASGYKQTILLVCLLLFCCLFLKKLTVSVLQNKSKIKVK